MTFDSIHDVRAALEDRSVPAQRLADALGITARTVRKARANQGPALDRVAAGFNLGRWYPRE